MLDVVASPPPFAPQPVAVTATADHHVSFHDVLSALNPLQYLPGIGTIYRAITNDQIPEPLRRLGSLVVSFLMAGPIGAALNLATMAVEKLSGIDLDQTGQALLAGMGAGPSDPTLANTSPAAAPPTVAASAGAPSPVRDRRSETPVPSDPASDEAWSPVQLAAYGVSTGGDGTLQLGGLSGADVLNSLELSRIRMAQFAYDRAVALVG